MAAWLRRVTDSWETQYVRFRQLEGSRPSLADCVQQHDAFLATRTQAAALRAVLGAGYSESATGRRAQGQDGGPSGAGAKKRSPGVKTRRGGRARGAAGEKDREGSESEGEEEAAATRPARRCAWPDKPRLPDDKLKGFRAECRKSCPETCFAFLVGTCKDAACTKSHDVPPAFEGIKKKFR